MLRGRLIAVGLVGSSLMVEHRTLAARVEVRILAAEPLRLGSIAPILELTSTSDFNKHRPKWAVKIYTTMGLGKTCLRRVVAALRGRGKSELHKSRVPRESGGRAGRGS